MVVVTIRKKNEKRSMSKKIEIENYKICLEAT